VGICGTDLHYYEHGYNATFVPDGPFILGHELTGEVVAVTDDIETVKTGQHMVREINFRGSMRYGDTFDEAIRLVAAGRVKVDSLINRVFALEHSVQALQFAADKSLALKVQIQP
jgi:threonine dehydrogenase-like Zn-dependent dehydrogenase